MHALCSAYAYKNANSPSLLFNLSLSRLSQLRSIQLAACDMSAIDSLASLLCNLSSPRLERVAFHLDYWEHPDCDTQLAWEEVDAPLQSSPFDGLKEACFDSTQDMGMYAIGQISRCLSQYSEDLRE
jgi:hypothetical protein